jgi:hypothetical protein
MSEKLTSELIIMAVCVIVYAVHFKLSIAAKYKRLVKDLAVYAFTLALTHVLLTAIGSESYLLELVLFVVIVCAINGIEILFKKNNRV